MMAGGLGHQHLGADAVRAGDQQGIGETGRLDVEQRPETAQARDHAGPGRRLRQPPDGLDEGGAGIDIDPGLLVGQAAVRWTAVFTPFLGNTFLLG